MEWSATVDEPSSSKSALEIPAQSAPIDRTPSGAAAFRQAAGVTAAQMDDWDDDFD